MRGEDGSDRLGPSCSMETSNAPSFWRAGSAESRSSETLRLFLQIRAPCSAGSNTRWLARIPCALTPALRPPIVHTRPLPFRSAFDQAGPHWLEMKVFHFLVIFLNASQSAVEKSWLPEKAPLFSARMGAKRRAHLDRFHYTREGDWETGEYDRMPRRGGSGQENPGGDERAQSTKYRAESTDQMLFILTPDL